MKKFITVEALYQLLLTEKKLVFESTVKKLTQFRVLLFSLATGDFNPAHCVPDFAKHSLFKGVVSQGIATLARAESEFLQILQFEEPVEFITSGLDKARYFAPLRIGDRYQYRYTISNLEKRKGLWKMECHIECIVIETGKIIAGWEWHPIFDVKQSLPKDAAKLLRPRPYWRNIFDNFIARPLSNDFLLSGGYLKEAIFLLKLHFILIVLVFPPLNYLMEWLQTISPVVDPATDVTLNYVGT